MVVWQAMLVLGICCGILVNAAVWVTLASGSTCADSSCNGLQPLYLSGCRGTQSFSEECCSWNLRGLHLRSAHCDPATSAQDEPIKRQDLLRKADKT